MILMIIIILIPVVVFNLLTIHELRVAKKYNAEAERLRQKTAAIRKARGL